MAYKVKGSVGVSGDITVNSKKVGTGVGLSSETVIFNADTNGHVELPAPSKTEIDSLLSKLPLSQYGAINDLPVGASGSYEGGTTVSFYSVMPSMLEADGTFVFLRPGTNGARINYYYTYINNPDDSTMPFSTIRPYYTGTSRNIIFYDSYALDTLIYQEIDLGKLNIVLTNGTLDNTHHQSASFNASIIPHNILTCLKVNNYVYIIALYNTVYDYTNPTNAGGDISNPFQFIFYRIPVSEIQAGTINTVQQVSGISGTTMYGETSPTNYVRIANTFGTPSNVSSNSFMKYPSDVSGAVPYTYSLIGSGKSIFDGTNIIFSFYNHCFCINTLQRLDTMYAVTVTFNVNTNTYTTNAGNTPIVFSGTNTTALSVSNPFNATTANTDGFGTSNSDGTMSSWYITNNGIQYAIREKNAVQDFYTLIRSKINNFTTKANAYIIKNRSLTLQDYSLVYSEYASRVGDKLAGGSPITPTRIMFSGTGTYEGTNYTQRNRGVSDIGTSRNYTYNSVNYNTITGYAPQIGRYPLPVESENSMLSKLSFCSSSNVIESYGCALFENIQLSAGYKLDPNTMLYDKTISISASTLTSIKNTILSSIGFSATNSRIAIYYSPRADMCKSIACIAAFNSSNAGVILAATIDCVISSDVITSITLNNVFLNEAVDNFTSFATYDTLEVKSHSGLSCVQYNDFTYISFSHLVSHNIPGNAKIYTVSGVVNSSSTITNVTMEQSTYAIGLDGWQAYKEYSYIPNLGFGYYFFDPVDFGTKLIFKYCGNTLSQLPNMKAGIGTNVVILSQDVTIGFYIYFTERTPVFLNGIYYELPITTLNLNTVVANPGNSTFYIYIRASGDTISYVASLTQVAESSTNMFIGTAVTDGTNVTSLNINKVSRFDIYRPSETQIGSAFPVSTGLPTQNGTINW